MDESMLLTLMSSQKLCYVIVSLFAGRRGVAAGGWIDVWRVCNFFFISHLKLNYFIYRPTM